MNYLDINRRCWNAKVDAHLQSDFYFVDEFTRGRTSLQSIELELLGDIKDKEILHLQCHFGQDSISLSRLGAKVTGIDFSEKAIAAAKNLAAECRTDTDFVLADVYELPKILDKKFDIVYTTYGVIGWLPDLEKWAQVISHFLKPAGKLIFVEFHPVIWMFDDDFSHIKYSYFNDGAIIETVCGTYADRSAAIENQQIGWNHSTAEVLTSLLRAGLEIRSFGEHNWSPYPCFRGIEEFEKGKFRIAKWGGKVPHVFSLVARKQ